jgi:G2/mitotic-specific cyclin 1/2
MDLNALQQITNENIKKNVLEGKFIQTKEISRKRSRGVLTDVTSNQNICQGRASLKQAIKHEEQKQLPRAKRIRLSGNKSDIENSNNNVMKHKETQIKTIKIEKTNDTNDKENLSSNTIANNISNDTKEDSLTEITKNIDKTTIKSSQENIENNNINIKKEDEKNETKSKEEGEKVERRKSIFEEEIEKAKAREELENDVEEEYPEKAREQDWDDLDAEDEFDPIMVSEYVNDIFIYLREKELTTKPDPEYIDNMNQELSWKMRTSLVDWIIQLHYAFKFCLETLYLTINIVDRFLSVRPVPSAHLPLVGIAALFIAAKYEEIIVPSVEQILKAANNCNTPEEVFIVERCILRELEFDLNYPSPLNFLRRISKADDYEMFGRTLSKFFMELSLLNNEFLNYLPSKITAASMYLSRIMLDRPEWTPNLRHYSGYHEDELKECVSLLIQSLASPPKKWNRSVIDKYALPKFGKVSLFARQWLKRNIDKAEDLI